jgi:hypothetical protein
MEGHGFPPFRQEKGERMGHPAEPTAAKIAPDPVIFYVMERVCSHCHALLAAETGADWCPACGGALIEREAVAALDLTAGPRADVDHRGIVLPRRHALGGIITPQ